MKLGDLPVKLSRNNPFPGLRAFEMNESYLYFGREGQSDEVIDILNRNKFVSILGSSGTGKSSLMFSGVIPILYSGFVGTDRKPWVIVTARPGLNPIENLAKAFAPLLEFDIKSESGNDALLAKAILNRSRKGIAHLYHSIKKLKGHNVLLYLDQFEEIFRYQDSKDFSQRNLIQSYINKILYVIQDRSCPVYIALSMRSDFLGDCERYPALTNKINESHYLIPQMDRDQKRLVIEGPISVAGADITNRLTQRLLNDLGDQPDQLPVLQHALMRTYDYWRQNAQGKDPIDLIHYEAIGTTSEALSRHADEAFFELDEERQKICEVLFKTITEKIAEGDGVRRPTSLHEIATIADTTHDKVIEVVEKFRQEGRALLMPAAGVTLTSDSIIDISHESLMRVWYKLKKWVDEEALSADVYLNLSESAQRYHEGNVSLMRPPELQVAIEWRNKYKPTLSWARQYASNFEMSISYLNLSEETYKEELEMAETIQRKKLRTSQIVATILGLAVIISFIGLLFAFYQKQVADEQTRQAMLNEERAQRSAEDAQLARLRAQEQSRLANLSNQRAIRSSQTAQQNAIEAEIARQQAERSRFLAEEKSLEAEQSRRMTEIQKDSALMQRRRAELSEENAQKLRLTSIARAMAIQSTRIDGNQQLQSILAQLAYKINNENGGDRYENTIYNGLFEAIKVNQNDFYEAFDSRITNVKSSVLVADRYLFSTGTEGIIYQWDLKEENPSKRIILQANSYFKQINASPDGSKVIGLTAGNRVIIYDKTSQSRTELNVPASYLYHAEITNEGDLYVSTSNNNIYRYDKSFQLSEFISTDSRVFIFRISTKGDHLFSGEENGKLRVWDLKQGELLHTLVNRENAVIHSLALSSSANQIAIGDKRGNVSVLKINEDFRIESQSQLVGHNNRIVTDLVFHEPNNQLVSSSTDGTVRIWNLDDPDKFPIVIDESDSWVVTISIDQTSDLIYAGCRDRIFRVYPLSAQTLSSSLTSFIERDITQEEWNRFVDPDIPFKPLNMRNR
ncbi:MAG: hypothetical protein JJU23_08305 [Cyclobacteriaceae bacterium]|nr:hypothetical protein [Cyclobacteriaceae bacterium]